MLAYKPKPLSESLTTQLVGLILFESCILGLIDFQSRELYSLALGFVVFLRIDPLTFDLASFDIVQLAGAHMNYVLPLLSYFIVV